MIDICVNWFKSSFNKDRESVLERAKSTGVTRIFTTGASLESSKRSAELAKNQPDIFSATAGIHPHYASSWDKQCHHSIETLIQKPEVLAVGECGLDFNRNFSSKYDQLLAFEDQVELAVKYKKPLFMHQRDAHDSFLDVIRDHRKDFTNGVVHCFTGTEAELEDYLELNLHIGLTGWICDERRGYHMHEFIPKIPLNRLMIETDSPYLVPRTMKPRPSRNEPAFLSHIVSQLASIYDCTDEHIISETNKTALKFYGI